MTARYAVYYVPEAGTALDVLGSGLLGRDASGAEAPRLALTLPEPLTLQNITISPRHYGLHATLKAPFELAAGYTELQLCDAVCALAKSIHSLLLPPLQIDTVPGGAGGRGRFLALTPVVHDAADAALHDVAARCVQELDIFRAPLSPQDITRREPLTERERAHLMRWGYHAVLEDFHFHITLTDAINDSDLRAGVAKALREVLAPVCAPHRISMNGLTLVRQSDRQFPFRSVASFPFTSLEQVL